MFLGPESEKEMMTGRHVVADIYCTQCAIVIGWTYVSNMIIADIRHQMIVAVILTVDMV